MMCVTGVYVREIIKYFFIDQLFGLIENVNIGIYLDTIKAINVKLCMMVLLIELYLLISCSVTLARFQGHSTVKQGHSKFKRF